MIDLRKLAEDLGMSCDHFRGQFKERFSIAPYQHRLLAKLSHARALLTTTVLNIGTVVEQLSFNDPFHFSRLYKRKFGVAHPSVVMASRRSCLVDSATLV
ncbi:MAG: helix-turn-helix transcriptional regulator [Gemmataceae bacterium]